MKKFLVNSSVILIIFFGILIAIYICLDPFKVVMNYDNYSDSLFILNREYIGTENFLKKIRKNKYNSFIMGSSRTMGFDPEYWLKTLTKKDTSFINTYTLDAFEESIEGIYSKLLFLNNKTKIKNILIILCRDKSFEYIDRSQSLALYRHPKLSSNTYLDLHIFYFKNFLNPDFFRRYMEYKFLGIYKPYMRLNFSQKKIIINPENNFLQFETKENWYGKDSIEFLTILKTEFEKRSKIKVDSISRIKAEHKITLNNIAQILKSNNIQYKIILSPLFEQMNWSPNDLNFLKNLFGSNLHDFSGVNEFTNNKLNYYESSHFRPVVGDKIMDIIY